MADRVYEFAVQLDATPFMIALPADGFAVKSSFILIAPMDCQHFASRWI
jgi:hypothetical protein